MKASIKTQKTTIFGFQLNLSYYVGVDTSRPTSSSDFYFFDNNYVYTLKQRKLINPTHNKGGPSYEGKKVSAEGG